MAVKMLFSINEKDSRPLYLQLVHQVREQVGSGLLKPGDELPSVRDLASSLGINLHTVRAAYLKLRDQGIIDLRLGRKARISRPENREFQTSHQVEFTERFREIITNARLQGFSMEQLRNLVEQLLEQEDEKEEK